MMPIGEVVSMLGQAFRAMVIGIAGVFAVLAVFYISVRLLMASKLGRAEAEEDDG